MAGECSSGVRADAKSLKLPGESVHSGLGVTLVLVVPKPKPAMVKRA